MFDDGDFDEDSGVNITTYVNTFQLTPVSINIVVYIAGYAVYAMKKALKCSTCIAALEDVSLLDNPVCHLLRTKRRGNLTIPSKDVITVCMETEQQFRESAYQTDAGANPYSCFDNPYKTLSHTECHNVMCSVLTSCQKYNVLNEIKQHVRNHNGPVNHRVYIIKMIVERFLKSRYKFAGKCYNENLKLAAKAKSRHDSKTETKQTGQ